MAEGKPCERCNGTGIVNDLSDRIPRRCFVCLGLGSYVRPPRKPPNEHHLIALHSTVKNWDEVIAMLPLREPKENWDE